MTDHRSFDREENKIITDFFENELSKVHFSSRQEFFDPLENWFTTTYNEILKLKKGDELRYKRTIDIVQKNLPELASIIEKYKEEGWYTSWKNSVLEQLEAIPEMLIVEQSETRYIVLPEDTWSVQLGKLFKKLSRSTKKLVKRTSEENGQKNPTQQVPLRNLLRYHSLAERGLLEKEVFFLYQQLTLVLDYLLQKDDVEITENSDKDDRVDTTNSSLKIDVIDTLENHLQSGIQLFQKIEKEYDYKAVEWLENISAICRERAEKAGTFELKSNYYSNKPVNSEIDYQQRDITKKEHGWIEYLECQLSDLQIQLEIARYGFVASNVQQELLGITHRFFRDYCYLPLEKGVTSTKQLIEMLSDKSSKKLSQKLIDSTQEKIDKEIREQLLSPFEELDVQSVMIEPVEKQLSDLQMEVKRFTETVHLSKKRDVKDDEPKIEMDTLKWQSLAARYLKSEAIEKMDPNPFHFDEFIEEMKGEIEESLQVAEINLDAAIDSKKEKESEQTPIEIAKSGLQRAMNTLETAIKAARVKQNEFESLINKELPEALLRLADVMLKRDYDDFELQDKAIQVKQKARFLGDELRKIRDLISSKSRLTWRFLSQKAKIVLNVTGRFLGFKDESSVSKTEKRNLTEYLNSNAKETKLPFVYKRIFSKNFEIDNRFYVPPQTVHHQVEVAFNQWKSGLESNILFTGEKGSGKTTACTFIQDSYFEGDKVKTLNIDQTIYKERDLIKILSGALNIKEAENRDQLIQKIQKRRDKTVFIVENIQNNYIRNINGFEALDAFWDIMSSTRESLFWIVSCSKYAWNFFEKMSDSSQLFSSIIECDVLTNEQIEKAIMLRHTSTGYELTFEPDTDLKNSRKFKNFAGDAKSEQAWLKENYFSRLAKISEGNISIAMLFWIESIKEFDDSSMTIAPLEIADVDKLDVPSRDVLFTLASLVIHDRLTIPEMAMSLHQEESEARMMLARLNSKGILFKSDSVYTMNHLVYRQVIRLLKRRNIIH